jgi:tRNA pseudouridine38-40 synthase
VAHVDIAKDFSADTVRDALNAHLRPLPISVTLAEAVGEDFHARFSATERTYWYRILNRRAPPALDRQFVWHVARPLDRDAMEAAGERLIGRHDFTTFRDAQCQAKSPIKTLDRFDVMRAGEEVHVWCAARSFLHRQVRSMVGTIVEAGFGKRSADDVAKVLAAKDRSQCGQVAPASGLHLMRVAYGARAEDEEFDDEE